MKGSRRRNPQAQMALTEHLRELRNRLIKAAIGLVVVAQLAQVLGERHLRLGVAAAAAHAALLAPIRG
jgi:Sec-independent protein secretion pathway component TatC